MRHKIHAEGWAPSMGNMTETSSVLSDKNAENSSASKKYHLTHLQPADFPTQQQIG